MFVFNLVALDSSEGQVLQKLFEKLEEIRNAMGSDKVSDVLDEVLYQQILAQLMMEAAANARSIDEILQELDIKVDEEYIQRILLIRLIDGTLVKEPEKTGSQWRIHESGQLPPLQWEYWAVTAIKGSQTGESFTQYPVHAQDCFIGDRGYAPASGIAHVVASRLNWYSNGVNP